ncbi:unnamed protein product [Chironomus riparius]|uniref:Uncharacterized protein n=1 Tax=Chironomus riparius TaxID=315576 RepID=A0A9N9WZF2_9DIPT|nr:unnamed protein product [Chironomus riparius]
MRVTTLIIIFIIFVGLCSPVLPADLSKYLPTNAPSYLKNTDEIAPLATLMAKGFYDFTQEVNKSFTKMTDYFKWLLKID